MIDLGTIAIIFLAGLAVVDFFVSRQTIELLRNRLVSYWVFVEGLPSSNEIESHVRLIRSALRKNQINIVTWLGILIAMLALVGPAKLLVQALPGPAAYIASETSVIKLLDRKMRGIYRTRYQLAALEEFNDLLSIESEETFEQIESCQTIMPLDRCRALNARISELHLENERLLSTYEVSKSEHSLSLVLSIAALNAVGELVFGSLLLTSFFLSFATTLWLLKSLERARVTAPIIIFFDLVLAIAIPIIAITSIMLLFAFLAMPDEMTAVINSESDGLTFNISVAAYLSISDLYLKIFPIMGARIYALSLFEQLNSSAAIYALELIWFYSSMQISQTFYDVWLTLQGKWTTINTSSAQRNWAVVASVSLSLFYLLAVAFLIITKRSAGFRYAVSMTLQNFAEHPKGPVGLAAIVAAAIIGFLKKVVTGA